MLFQHIRLVLVVVLICVYCCTRMTYRDQILLHSMRQVESLALVEPDGQLLFEGAMQGMIDKLSDELGDEYSAYIPPSQMKEFREMLDVKLEGIGVRFDPTSQDGTYRVLYPMLDSPAIAAGIRCGDTIVKVDGEDVAGLSILEISKKIRGPEETSVILTVQHVGEEKPVDISITRKSIQQNTVYGFEVGKNHKPILNISPSSKIGYIYISSFNSHTAQEVTDYLLEHSSRIEKLIIDIRGNPGGFLDAAVGIADLFVDDRGRYREIVTTHLRSGLVKPGGQHYATRNVMFHGPMVVLIDNGSASASEILAACLQDFERATIIGERTYGKGTVQEIFELPFNLGTIKLTDASFWRPSGKNINRVRKVPQNDDAEDSSKLSQESDDWGVSPDIKVEMSRMQKVLTYFLREIRIAVPQDQVVTLLKQYAAILLKNSEELLKKIDEEEYEDVLDNEDEEGKSKESDREHENSEHGDQENVDDMEKQDKADNNNGKDNRSFKPAGQSPYYDPVLDKAIEFLNQGSQLNQRQKSQLPREL